MKDLENIVNNWITKETDMLKTDTFIKDAEDNVFITKELTPINSWSFYHRDCDGKVVEYSFTISAEEERYTTVADEFSEFLSKVYGYPIKLVKALA